MQRRVASVDIGGTLAKIAFVSLTSEAGQFPHLESITIDVSPDQVILFNHFQSSQIFELLQYFNKYLGHIETVALTGGGAFKYQEEFESLNKSLVKVKQFDSLVSGLSALKEIGVQDEFFSFEKGKRVLHNFDSADLYPILMVNVGSGASMLKISSDNNTISCQRVGGTCLGGGFFLGLCQLILGSNDFPKLLKQAQQGNNLNVDIGPSDFDSLQKNWPQLMDAPVLVSLGKLKETDSKEDISNSLFVMIASNIAQLSLMQFQLHKVRKAVFTGFFCRNNSFMLECVNRAFQFFTKNHDDQKPVALGLKHDGYLGALGSLYTLMQK